MRYLILLLLLLPAVYAECPDVKTGRHPGWEERYFNETDVGTPINVEDFTITVTKIFSEDAIHVTVLKHLSEYAKFSVTKGFDLKKPDIWIELYNATPGTGKANISIYTPQKANLSVNLTNIDIFNTVSGRTQLMPNEEFQLQFSLNNTGELEALNISISPVFGNFTVLETDAKTVSLCQGSAYNFKYVLKAPDVRKIFNYTLYLKIEYYDINEELAQRDYIIKYYPIEVEISPAIIEVERKVSNWSLATSGRDLIVEVVLNNTGKSTAYNVEWSDTPPPDFIVTQGTTSWKGDIPGGQKKFFTYRVISDDPIMCSSISKVTYEDRYKNKYISFSNTTTAKFSPFIGVEKKIDGTSWYKDPEKFTQKGNITLRVGSSANASVKIKNRGNAIARGLIVEDSADVILNGINKWFGDLKPDEEVFYNYTFKIKKDADLSTNVTYLEIDPAAFNTSIIEQKTPEYCSKTLKNTSYAINASINILYPDVSVSLPSEIKVLSDFEFDFNVTLTNNGTDAVHSIFTYIDTAELRGGIRFGGEILKGQPLYYLKELKGQNSYSLVLRAPLVENESNFKIPVTVNYTDFYGNVYTINATGNLTVIRPKPAYAIIIVERKELQMSISAGNETEIGEYAEGFIKLKSTGLAPLEKVEFNLSLPPGIELATNDTGWEGRREAQMRRAGEAWYIFSGNISWKGNLSIKEEKNIPFLIRGTKAGMYVLPYHVGYDGSVLSGELNLKVKGAILEIKKFIEKTKINLGEKVRIAVAVKNIGEDTATNVFVQDEIPAGIEVLGNTTKSTELKPGEETSIEYAILPSALGRYYLGSAKVKWTDRLRNEYSKESEPVALEVAQPQPELLMPPKTPSATPAETPLAEAKISIKEILGVLAFVVILLAIIIKMLSLSKPVKK